MAPSQTKNQSCHWFDVSSDFNNVFTDFQPMSTATPQYTEFGLNFARKSFHTNPVRDAFSPNRVDSTDSSGSMFIDMRALPCIDDRLFETAGLADAGRTNEPEALFFPNASEIGSTIIGMFEKTMELSHYARQCTRRFHFFLSARVLARSAVGCSDQKRCVQFVCFRKRFFVVPCVRRISLGPCFTCFQRHNIHRRYVDTRGKHFAPYGKCVSTELFLVKTMLEK